VKGYILTEPARRDLDDIWTYLANENVETSFKIMLAVGKAFDKVVAKIVRVVHGARDLRKVLALPE